MTTQPVTPAHLVAFTIVLVILAAASACALCFVLDRIDRLARAMRKMVIATHRLRQDMKALQPDTSTNAWPVFDPNRNHPVCDLGQCDQPATWQSAMVNGIRDNRCPRHEPQPTPVPCVEVSAFGATSTRMIHGTDCHCEPVKSRAVADTLKHMATTGLMVP